MKIKVINLNGIKRVVTGKLVDQIDVDYTQDLRSLKSDLEFILETIIEINMSKPLAFLKKSPKNIVIYEGSNHLDIVEHNVGTLGWLLVQDHLI